MRIDPADYGLVNPTVPHWGGPLGVADPLVPVTSYRAYGNSLLRQGLTVLSPMTGVPTQTYDNAWVHGTITVLPGIPGDSGMPLMTDTGLATGVLSRISLLPNAGQLLFTDLALAMKYADQHDLPGLQLARGGPFNPNQLPLGV